MSAPPLRRRPTTPALRFTSTPRHQTHPERGSAREAAPDNSDPHTPTWSDVCARSSTRPTSRSTASLRARTCGRGSSGPETRFPRRRQRGSRQPLVRGRGVWPPVTQRGRALRLLLDALKRSRRGSYCFDARAVARLGALARIPRDHRDTPAHHHFRQTRCRGSRPTPDAAGRRYCAARVRRDPRR